MKLLKIKIIKKYIKYLIKKCIEEIFDFIKYSSTFKVETKIS